MIKSAVTVLLGTSLVLFGLSFGEDFSRTILKSGITEVEQAHAATSTGGVTLSTNVQTAITLTLSTGTIPLGNLTPGTPIVATTSATIATNNSTGITFQTNRNTAGQTLLHTDATTPFPDATAYATAGSGNATTTNLVGANLHFKVAFAGTDAGLYTSAHWGANDTDGAGNAKYGGFPVTAQSIASSTSYVSGDQTVVTRYRIDAPATQKSGSYSGGITYTAYSNP